MIKFTRFNNKISKDTQENKTKTSKKSRLIFSLALNLCCAHKTLPINPIYLMKEVSFGINYSNNNEIKTKFAKQRRNISIVTEVETICRRAGSYRLHLQYLTFINIIPNLYFYYNTHTFTREFLKSIQ